jgi:beta-barrel assembly-enhancing protease
MKYPLTVLLFLTFLLSASALKAQFTKDSLNFYAVAKSELTLFDYKEQSVTLPAGSRLALRGYGYRLMGRDHFLSFEWENQTYFGRPHVLQSLQFEGDSQSLDAVWLIAYLQSKGFQSLLGGSGVDVKNRVELQEEFANMKEQLDLFEEPFLENYLNAQVRKLSPPQFAAYLPAQYRVKVYRSQEPYAFATTPGTIFLSTGLLGLLKTEDELMAILAKELSHIVLDHSLINYRNDLARIRRAQFWAGFATVAAGAIEFGSAADRIRRGTYHPLELAFLGDFTQGVAGLSFGLAANMSARVGTQYTQEQIEESQRMVETLLSSLQLDADSYAVFWRRCLQYYRQNEQFFTPAKIAESYVGAGGRNMVAPDHPKLNAAERDFLKRMTTVNLYTLWAEYRTGNYRYAEQLAELYLKHKLATPDLVVFYSNISRVVNPSPERLNQLVLYLKAAEQMALSVPADLYKELSLVYHRLGSEEQSLYYLQRYKSVLLEGGQIDAFTLWWIDNHLEALSK